MDKNEQYVLVWVGEDENFYVGPFATREAAEKEAADNPVFEEDLGDAQLPCEFYVETLARPSTQQ